tara:strand:+ start:3927 stop:4394 length:468 start_codon:yes stop_codon:yes gene_type:complete
VAEYKNYVNLDFDPATLDRLCTPVAEVSPDDEFFVFAHNTRAVRSNFVHFQLRNLVWSTSKNDAYVMSENKIVHWNSQTRRATTTLDLDGGGGGMKTTRNTIALVISTMTWKAAFPDPAGSASAVPPTIPPTETETRLPRPPLPFRAPPTSRAYK